MAITASQITSSQTLEEFRLEFNKLQSDVTILKDNPSSITIPDDGNIGSASDTDAIAIASNGVVTFSQIPVLSAGITVSGTYTGGGLMTTGGNIVIPDDGNIGSVSHTDAIQIAASDGRVDIRNNLWVNGSYVALDTDGIILYFGENNEIAFSHVHNVGLNLRHTAGADNTPIKLTLQSFEDYITVDELIGAIDFQAIGENSGTDAILVCAGIEAVSEGTFANDNNATKLSFKTAASEVAAEKMALSSTGVLTLSGGSGALVIPDAGNIGSASDTDAIAIASNGAVTFSQAVSARKPIKTEFNASGAVTASLTTAESGATVLIHGTENNVINLPAAANTNPGLYYDFIIMTAVASGKSTIVNIAGSGGNFVGALSLAGGTAANAVLDNAGDAFTFVASTVVGSRARITCLTDDGTDGVWQAESVASPIATID